MEIKLKNVNYNNLINNITYSFENEKITAIIGTSGSGKTVLSYLITGILEPTSGEIKVSDEIGYLFQNSEDQLFNNLVSEEISFGLANKKYDIKKRVFDSLRMVGLTRDYYDRKIASLSDSEKVKVALASILSMNPKILILDEPTIYLDNRSILFLIRLIKKLKKDYHKTIIVISNDINFVYEIADNILLLNKGKIILKCPKDEITDNILKIKKGGMEIPKILEFILLVKKKKNIELTPTNDIKELMKDIYRNV